MKRNAVVDAVLTPDMRKWLREGVMPSTYTKEVSIDTTINLSPVKPSPTRSGYTVVKATVASETEKAYNLKVELNPKSYAVDFPFKPILFIWMPKKCCNKIDSNYWEVLNKIANDNLNKAMIQLKKKLIDSYGFDSTEIIKINNIHLM